MNEFKVLDPNGHTRTEWDAQSAEEVETARRVYDEFIRRGYRAFRVDARTGESSVTNAFDPKDKETLLVPPIRAG
jgi:hypothetical protein